jgi:murein hydrolase activator
MSSTGRSIGVLAILLIPVVSEAQRGGAGAGSNPIQEDLKAVGRHLTQEQDTLKRLRSESSSVLRELSAIERDYRTAQGELSQAQALARELTSQLAEQEAQRAQAQDRYTQGRDRLRRRLRALYKLGDVGWMNLVFGAPSVAEGLERISLRERLIRQDRRLMAETQRQSAVLLSSNEEIRRRTEALLAQKTQVERRREEAALAKAEQQKALQSLQGEEALHKKTIEELSRARGRLAQVLTLVEGAGSAERGFGSWKGRLRPPVEGARVEVPFGLQKDRRFNTVTRNQGVDLRASEGAQVRVVYPGTVVFAEPFEGYGLTVIIDHGAQYYTLYAHLGGLSVHKGDKLGRDAPVGTLGDTGSLKGPYLYFEVRKAGRAVDPKDWVRFE